MTVPKTSVIIASGAGGEFIFRCLASLREQASARGVEIIVVDRVGDAVRRRAAREFPSVRVIATTGDHRATVPEMRRVGVEAARGSIVAILEEHCTAPGRWLEAIETSVQAGDAAIGGPILDRDFERLRDWVVYFSDTTTTCRRGRTGPGWRSTAPMWLTIGRSY